MMHLSSPRWSFFRRGFARLSAAGVADRRLNIFFVSLMFMLPSIYVYTAGSPKILSYCMQKVRWIEVPPQADPSILRGKKKETEEGNSNGDSN